MCAGAGVPGWVKGSSWVRCPGAIWVESSDSALLRINTGTVRHTRQGLQQEERGQQWQCGLWPPGFRTQTDASFGSGICNLVAEWLRIRPVGPSSGEKPRALLPGTAWCSGCGRRLGPFLWAPEGRVVVRGQELSLVQVLPQSSHQYIHVFLFLSFLPSF